MAASPPVPLWLLVVAIFAVANVRWTAVSVEVAYICTHPAISVEVALFDVVRVVVFPTGTVRVPSDAIVVVAEPPK